ncbi:MAG: hypothetical protein HKM06_00390 [Spirochaetales bacterium]|nr:hypothetical protein [Spirochaetales bacterium]
MNNYSWISFSFSPLLLDELSQEAPNVYRRLRDADRDSLSRWGHGNALAQLPHPVILPLASERDVKIQLDWAFEAFEHHFHRAPEGFFLPRQAVNFSVIDELIERRVRWILLSPWQVQGLMRRGEGSWSTLGNAQLNTDRCYAIDRPRGSLGVFFHNIALAEGIEGGHFLKNATTLAQTIREILDHSEGNLASTAVDGTWFGHQEPFGDMCLAALWDELKGKVNLSNYGSAMEHFPPVDLVKLKRGDEDAGISATCPHGVERWRSGCGCGEPARPGLHQGWRPGLRQAFSRLQEALTASVEQTLEELGWPAELDFFQQVGKRRWRSLPLLPENGLQDPGKIRLLLTCAEVVFHSQALLSAGLFEGSEPDSPEALDAWFAAARSIDLAHELTAQDIEFSFIQELSEVFLNTQRDAAQFFESQVLPYRKDTSYPAALFVLDHLVRAGIKDPIVLGNFRLLNLDQARDQIADKVFRYSGALTFIEDKRDKSWTFGYLLVEDLHEGVSLFLQEAGDTSAPQAFDLTKLPQGERDQIVGLLSGDLEDLLTDSTEDLFPLLRKSLVYSKLLGSDPLPVTKTLVSLVLNRRLSKELGKGLETPDEGVLDRIEQDFDFAQEFKIQLDDERLKNLFTDWLSKVIDGPHRPLDDPTLQTVDRLMSILERHGLRSESTVAQTMVFETLTGSGMRMISRLDGGEWDVLPAIRNLIRLGELFHIDTHPLQDRVLHLGKHHG